MKRHDIGYSQEEGGKRENIPPLPPELWILILSFLPLRRKYRFATVSHQWACHRLGIVDQSVEYLNGHDVSVFVPDGQEKTSLVYVGGRLANLQMFDLRGLPCAINLDGHDFSCLAHRLTRLWLPLTRWRMTSNEAISQLTNLHSLSIGPSDYLSRETYLALSRLTRLSVYKNAIVGDETLAYLTNLRRLSLDNQYDITHEGIEKLSMLTSLKLAHCKVQLGHLRQPLHDLKRLKVYGHEEYMDMDFDLCQLPSLENLQLPRSDLHCIDHLERLTRLTRFLYHTKDIHIHDRLGSLTNLHHLTICGTGDSSVDPIHIKKLTQLTTLRLVCSSNIQSFADFAALTDLAVNDTSMTLATFQSMPTTLRTLKLTHDKPCRHGYGYGECHCYFSWIHRLGHLKHLTHLDLNYNTMEFMKDRVYQDFPRLQTLHLRGIYDDFPDLLSFHLEGIPITDYPKPPSRLDITYYKKET